MAETWYLAVCGECRMVVPFRELIRRDTWVDVHVKATEHHVLRVEHDGE